MKITTINIKILEKKMVSQFGDLPEFMDFEYFKKNVGNKCFCFVKLGKISFKTRKCENGRKRIDSEFHDHSLGKTKNGEVSGYYVLMH